MQTNRLIINPKENKSDKIEISDSLAATYALDRWAQAFNLMTAGYRDQLDPQDAANPAVAINLVTIAILGEAKARVFKRKGIKGQPLHVHVGGETRPHTQAFISILARVYAANDFVVHLRQGINTTPIWYSSFGVFYEELQSGDNLTASHSQFFKGGWKPLDALGKQLLEEEDDIIKEVQAIVRNRQTIFLAPWSNANILHDFDVDEPYSRYQKTVIDDRFLEEIRKAGQKGFRCSICTVGGSMKLTSERLFKYFDIPVGKDGIINYFFDEEDSQYHKIGQIDGENYGVDPTKSQIYRNIGAQKKILDNEANIVFIWDPDGDRFNMVTAAPAENVAHYKQNGLEVEQFGDSDRCIVYFTPNQIYFMLVAHRIEALKKSKLIDAYDWFVASSVTTSWALDELAALEKLPIVHVRVGFKHWGTFAQWLENRANEREPYKTALRQDIYIGKNPRLIIMCEESGGAVFGGSDLLCNKSRSKKLVGMREKDGFQLGLLSLSLAASLYIEDCSIADFYLKLLSKHKIKFKHFNRYDKRLYDESLTGTDLQHAKKRGAAQRDQIMGFFRDMARQYPDQKSLDQIQADLNARIKEGDALLPRLKNISLIGEGGLLEGTFLQFDSFWFVIRASGTDAVLRYYINGLERAEMEACQKSLMNLQI